MKSNRTDFVTVTELSGDQVTEEQVCRLCNRYYWAAQYCTDKDVLEIACGPGQGLGFLQKNAKSLIGADISKPLLDSARSHYSERIPLKCFDAQQMPLEDESKDVIILFEAIYYLPDVHRFIAECKRILRPGGVVLISTANKDLYDFNPSPYSHRYYGSVELKTIFNENRFDVTCFGSSPVAAASFRQKILRPLKKAVVKLGLMPKTMTGKKLLKRIVFGKMVAMPAEIDDMTAAFIPPVKIDNGTPDTQHKVIYCAAVKL